MEIEKHNSKKRRFGEFFTPIIFASKSFEYIKAGLGKKFLDSGNWRIWDSAAGTGNLIYSIDKEYHKYIYLSTLYNDDVEEVKKRYPTANIFNYDYLNDDVDNLFLGNEYLKLPTKLIDDLNNKDIKWLIYINPPYATSQSAGTNSKSKKNVSASKIREYMHSENLGEVSRELYSQFIYRINREFENKNAYLAMFSKINYINSNNNQKLRNKIFNYKFDSGFLFSSFNFDETSKALPFPVAFALWDITCKIPLDRQNLEFDVLDNNASKIDTRELKALDKSMLLNNWIERYKNINTMPPLSSAITVKKFGNDIRDRVADGFIASLMSCGNDIQKQNLTAILSSPQASAGSLSITKDNFEKAVIILSVRRIAKTAWLNSSEQFKKPEKESECLADKEFIMDCLIYTIFSNANQTASMRNVEYKDKTYNIKNNFFPLLIKDMLKLNIKNTSIANSIKNDTDRFIALYIEKNKISSEAFSVLEAGLNIYRLFFEAIDDKEILEELKIEYWDVGYFQIKNYINKSRHENIKIALKELNIIKNILSKKIGKKIDYYNFI